MNQTFYIVKASLKEFFQEAKEANVTAVWVGNRATIKNGWASIKIEVSAVRIVDGQPLIMLYSLLFWEGLPQDGSNPSHGPNYAEIDERIKGYMNEALSIGLSVNSGLLSLHPLTSETK